MLSDSESEYENDVQLTINEHYAKAFERKKEREELSQLQEKYGPDAENLDDEGEDSEEGVSEDEDGEELTPAVDAAILRTLARIKKKDPSIYDGQKDVFEEEQQKITSTSLKRSQKDKSKPLLMRQHVLNSTLNPTSRSPSPALPTHVEEQAALRKETISAFHTAVSGPSAHAGDGDDDDDDILVPREKTKDELEREEEEYREFLEREVGEDIGALVTVEKNAFDSPTGEKEQETKIISKENEASTKKKKRKGKGKEKKKESDQEFLMNYILNRGWIDKSDRHVPTYREITSTSGPKANTKKGGEFDDENPDDENREQQGSAVNGEDGIDDFDEEDFDDFVEEFESSYNFRFEEPGADTISSHPRNIASTVRRADDRRKVARERKKERKEEELVRKQEEVKRMKALKKKEIKAKLERIGREGGLAQLDDEVLEQLDLDADWDPETHAKQMEEIFGGAEEEMGEDLDDEKPSWNDDIDVDDLIPDASSSSTTKKSKKKKAKKDSKKADVVDDDSEDQHEDGNYSDEDVDAEEWDGTEASRQRLLDGYVDRLLSRSSFTDKLAASVGLRQRFRYTPVVPSSYGLAPEEILLADDADLNTYVGLRKLAPYREENDLRSAKGKKKATATAKGAGGKGWERDEVWEPRRVAKLNEFKKTLKDKRERLGIQDQQKSESSEPTKKRMGKKERLKRKLAAAVADETEVDITADGEAPGGAQGNSTESEPLAKKRKRKHKSAKTDV